MIILTGASASGKTETALGLARKYGLVKAITTTTREIRINETNGVDYFFVTPSEFEKMIREDKFVEYTLFNGNLYGSTKDQIANNKCVVIDPAGLRSYVGLKDSSIVTFYLEADEETRRARMVSRGDELEKIESRIKHDREAFKKENIVKVDYIIKNSSDDVLEDVCDQIYKIYHSIDK